jgi:hypothetical protein
LNAGIAEVLQAHQFNMAGAAAIAAAANRSGCRQGQDRDAKPCEIFRVQIDARSGTVFSGAAEISIAAKPARALCHKFPAPIPVE